MREDFTKSFYKMKEVSEMTGIPQTTIRYWESEFPELKPRRSAHNQRYYTPVDIETLEIIRFLLHTKGMKIDSAREYLKHNKKNVSKKIKVIEKLEEVKGELEILLDSLNVRWQKLDD